MHAEQGGAAPQLVNMVLSIGILGSGFFGAGMRAVMDREANILRRFKVAPIGPGPILVSSLVAGLVHFLPLAALTIALAHYLYGMAIPDQMGSLILFIAIGLLAFRAMGSIIGAVANTMQESQIIIQILYFPMLFLGGATFPLGAMSPLIQTIANFVPSSHLSFGMQGIMLSHKSIADLGTDVSVLFVTVVLGLFLSVKLFRWEKDEKMKPSAKLWVLVVLIPFMVAGAWQVRAKTNAAELKIQHRAMERGHSLVIRDAQIFLGDGNVIDRGSVLIRDGKIAEVFTGPAPEAKSLKAEAIEAAGKTLLPGLIDVHVHLGNPGGFWDKPTDYKPADVVMPRALAAYLYSGVTAVKSAGDTLPDMLRERGRGRSGEKLGAELFLVGPLFTAEGGHGTEYSQYLPQAMRAAFDAQFLRVPHTAEEARKYVAELKTQGVDGIKIILEGAPPFKRMDVALVRAVTEAAHAAGLPVVCHTGDARDVADAVDAGVDGIEHGSARGPIPADVFGKMKAHGTTYDPTLTVLDAFQSLGMGRMDPLDRSLVRQVAPPGLIDATKRKLSSDEMKSMREAGGSMAAAAATQNLIAAWHAGVMLVTGTDSGNPMLIHGPAVHRELQLWVAAGIPPAVALQAATQNSAQLLHAGNRIGAIKKGYEANLLLVNGDPLQSIGVTEQISMVVFKGEAISRSRLFEEQ
jgi:imidazolonepropionase-like amidohydrolase/ABC-type transport system involved in cytochrome c biogenesis permease component